MKLSAQNIGVVIGGKTILNNASVDFAEGKCTAIIGRNGAGKSTLLKVLARLSDNYSGEVLLDGQNTQKIPRKKLAQSIAVLPQHTAAPPDTTVLSLVDFGRFPYRSIFGKDTPQDKAATSAALAATGLCELKHRKVESLSGGERQRAFLAMALAQEPQILLLDEPTTYLDIAHQSEVMRIVRRIADEQHITVIMVLHDITHALLYADEIVVVKDRGIFAKGAPRTVLTPALVEKVYGVPADTFTNANGLSVILPRENVTDTDKSLA